MHEQTLAYRYLPATDQERELVVKYFPERTFTGKEGELKLTDEAITYAPWPDAVAYSQITGCSLNDSEVLVVECQHRDKPHRKIKLRQFGTAKQEVLDTINHYGGKDDEGNQLTISTRAFASHSPVGWASARTILSIRLAAATGAAVNRKSALRPCHSSGKTYTFHGEDDAAGTFYLGRRTRNCDAQT